MSPPAALSVLTISLHQIDGGAWQATCGRCLARSAPIIVSSKDVAWTELTIQGWSVYKFQPHATGYAICPECSGKPWSADDSVKRAVSRRKRR
jgi:hypothetical protein